MEYLPIESRSFVTPIPNGALPPFSSAWAAPAPAPEQGLGASFIWNQHAFLCPDAFRRAPQTCSRSTRRGRKTATGAPRRLPARPPAAAPACAFARARPREGPPHRHALRPDRARRRRRYARSLDECVGRLASLFASLQEVPSIRFKGNTGGQASESAAFREQLSMKVAMQLADRITSLQRRQQNMPVRPDAAGLLPPPPPPRPASRLGRRGPAGKRPF